MGVEPVTDFARAAGVLTPLRVDMAAPDVAVCARLGFLAPWVLTNPHFRRGHHELRTDVRNLFEHCFGRQSLFHYARHDMLEEQHIETAHHNDGVKDHQERRHRSAEAKTAVQDHEGNGEDREPDVRAQPALHCSDTPERDFFSQAQEDREKENRERDRAIGKAERRPADRMMLGRRLTNEAGTRNPGGQRAG